MPGIGLYYLSVASIASLTTLVGPTFPLLQPFLGRTSSFVPRGAIQDHLEGLSSVADRARPRFGEVGQRLMHLRSTVNVI